MSLSRAIELAALLEQRSYYDVLGVAPSCSSDEIDRRYYLLAPQLHPDRFARRATAEQLRALTRISARLTEARRVLLSPKTRTRYDEGLGRGELRLREDDSAGLEDHRDPRTPVARKLLEAALELASTGKRRQALAKLKMAAGFEADSQMIAAAIVQLEAEDEPANPPRQQAAPPDSVLEVIADAPTGNDLVPMLGASRQRDRPPTAPPDETLAARRHARIPLSARVALKLGDWKRFETLFTRNLSLGGVFVKTKKDLAVGSPVELSFALPDGSSFELPGRIARRVGGDGDRAGVGVQFLEMPAQTKQHIEELLARIVTGPTPQMATPADSISTDDLTLEAAVPELLRVRSCPPHEALGLDADLALDRDAIESAYAERSAPLGHSMLTAGEPNLISAIAELTAHLMYARDTLLEELESESEEPAMIHDSAPRRSKPLRSDDSVSMEIHAIEETAPRRLPPPLPARPVLVPQSLADLGPGGVAASEDATLADRIFELIAEGHYEAALELIARLVPNQAPPRLIAARHIARGYLAEQQGDLDSARVEFESALVVDRTSCEAIVRLRKRS